jgi:hypothetical protein
VMEPYGYHWYRMGGLGYLLERSEAWREEGFDKSRRSCLPIRELPLA